jgi:hypothetical protein
MIRITPRKGFVAWAYLLFVLVWIAAFCVLAWAGASPADVHEHTTYDDLCMAIVFTPVFAYGGWLLFSEEAVTAEKDALTVHRRCLGMGLKRTFDAGGISGIQSREPGWCIVPSQRGGVFMIAPYSGSITFRYAGRRSLFGPGLTDEQARQVINRLRHYLPHSAFANS